MELRFEDLHINDMFINIMSDINNFSEKYNIKVNKGNYKDIRLSTMFESFEFNLYNNGNHIQIDNMIHLPNLITNTGWHTEFKGGLNKAFTLEDCFKYANYHSRSKYTNEFIVFDDDLKYKIGNKKDKKYPKPNIHSKHKKKRR